MRQIGRTLKPTTSGRRKRSKRLPKIMAKKLALMTKKRKPTKSLPNFPNLIVKKLRRSLMTRILLSRFLPMLMMISTTIGPWMRTKNLLRLKNSTLSRSTLDRDLSQSGLQPLL